MATQKCDVFALGLGIGVLAAAYALFLGLAGWLFPPWGTELVTAMSSLYIGYDATFLGSILGAIWAFVDGFIAGVVIAWVYNRFQK
jgi:hypothetical protein